MRLLFSVMLFQKPLISSELQSTRREALPLKGFFFAFMFLTKYEQWVANIKFQIGIIVKLV